jgi:hypothetical protein
MGNIILLIKTSLEMAIKSFMFLTLVPHKIFIITIIVKTLELDSTISSLVNLWILRGVA